MHTHTNTHTHTCVCVCVCVYSFKFSSLIGYCRTQRCGFDPWVEKIPWRRKWQPTPVFLPGEEIGGLKSKSSQRVRHDWSDSTAHDGDFENLFICLLDICVFWEICLDLLLIFNWDFFLIYIELHKMFDIFRRLTLTGHIFRKNFLFALLMVSFTVQKHLSLIKYHFFIFIFISITLG